MIDIGQAVAQAIAGLIILCIVGGIIAGVGASYLIPWVFHHLSIGWN